MRMNHACAIAFALCLGAAGPVNGAVIDGTLNITGSATVSADEIDFLPLGGGDGEFQVSPFAPGTGSFSGMGALSSALAETGSILDLMLPGDPVGSDFLKPGFLTFMNFPNLMFTLTFIEPGVSGTAMCGAAPEVGQVCSPHTAASLSPFNLQNTAGGWTASFDVAGFVTDGSSDPASSFTGTFSTQNTEGQTFQDLLQIIGTPGGSVSASYSAQFDVNGSGLAPVPEPGSVFLIGAGLLGLGFIKRRSS